MEGLRLFFVKFVILFVGHSSAEHCDRATTAQVRAGNLGQSADFNWLGVLHVHLHDGDKIRVAMTGIVLVKIKYALANADDVVRIPQRIFKSDSKAMFLVARDTPWVAKLKSYVTHPEYEYSTLNTIAIVELNHDETDDFPLNPICIPTGETFNASRYLYLTGFTDENQKMEKVIYNIQYLEKKVCEEFYNRAGLSSQKRIPSVYLCGYASGNVTHCVWDNGMALVSNVTGYFHLIGFGIHGPGCAAPARFIDLFPYFSWINSVTSPDEGYYDGGYRRKGDDEFIPIHELFTANGSRRAESTVYEHEFERYPFEADALKHHLIMPTENDKAILIFIFNDTWEQYHHACKLPKVLMYKEHFELNALGGKKGVAHYKLSLYDLVNTVCSCVRMTVDCDEKSEAILSFKEEINYREGTHLNRHNTYKTPEKLFKSYVGIHRTKKPKQSEKWEPNLDLLEPAFINDDDVSFRRVLNFDLYIQFEFTDRAILRFEIFAEPGPMDPNRKWPTLAPRTITTTKTTTTTAGAEKTTTTKTAKAKKTTNTKTAGAKKTKSIKPGRRANSRVQTTAKSHWGMVNLADNMLKEAEVSLMTDVEEVQETESVARSEGAPGAVVVACWLVSACLRRAFFIN